MRIEELIIDGFKSYPVRTHVSGFDASFNAITGLNGSGKSNILDSICFVLGITNLTAVRANNLQDLIYKRGQAGITKASVTIVFDNSDRSKSPVSFENCPQLTVTRQIAMGGLSKYLINGHKATQQAVQNMFQSVQLNINNPNFLIMQGKITKVLNMKPAEILSMIEEAAGTRMFEDRKDKAIKTMSKKDQKVKEITALLEEEITPKLDKLREEKRSFLEYQKASTELDRLTRLAKAYEWQQCCAKFQERKALVDQKSQDVEDRENEAKALKRQIEGIEKELAQIEKKKEAEVTKGGKLQALLNQSKELQHDLVKRKTNVDLKMGSVEEERKKLQADQANLEALHQTLQEKEVAIQDMSGSFSKLKADYDGAVADVNKQDELLQTLLTGMTSSSKNKEGSAGGYMGQIAAARAEETAAGTEIEQSKLRIGHLEKEVKQKEPLAKKAQKDAAGLMNELESCRTAVQQLEAQMDKLGWDDEKEKTLLQSKAEWSRRVSDLVERKEGLKSKLAGMDFQYSDPEPNFDRSRVKGLVASLVQLDQDKHKYSTALEICAGGRLYNVVVEDEKVGSQLLAKGQLKKRVTLIPLNKINAFVTSAEKIGAAKRLAPGKVDLALTLVGYDDEVSKAMEYVFGNTLICADAATAKRVTFDNAVRMKSVTLDGDVYDPAGTLSGGSKPNSANVLVKMQDLIKIDKALKEAKVELSKVESEVQAAKAQMATFSKAKRDLDLKRHQVTLLEGQMSGSNATRIIGEVEKAKASIAELKHAIDTAKQRQVDATKEAKRLEKEMEEFDKNKDSKLDQLKGEIKRKKAELSKRSGEIKTRQGEVRTLELELEQTRTEITACEETIGDGEKAIKKVESELCEMQCKLESVQSQVDSVEAKLTQERATLSGYDDELSALRDALKSKKQEIADGLLSIKQLTHDREKLTADVVTYEKLIQQLELQFEWISSEQRFFGQSGTVYDFGKHNMSEVRKRCKKLEETQMGMRKKVNPKVLSMIEGVEKKESTLKTMLSTVLKDKDKIEDTIIELDRYKLDALQTTWEKVNADFGSIFGELLPGNYAKLQPPEGHDLTQGLEVKVRLGTVWKQSLTELSGGQRSLIALSLIMSLLQFKPAPMYILDEIDAALDLSHTQHIGQLFRNRFRGSQFIVVSLKEGLFTNANVLFRARFRDGTSLVERTVNANRTTTVDVEGDKENVEPGVAGRKRGGKAGAGGALGKRGLVTA
ncbi:probable SMC2 - chromosome segregation protein [Melanopsichium pennsylvanicum]|uniref:Structural maintenance of chromosomes protein n=2 Tax=Melanopsichium pennsylvanicum TaxID=63383 RepID=A0AAJ5C4H8_9BASI|nr:probable SMC2-chromosome segregation protein [Melanopsichium pennsylvanicum 4]SNX83715.1 probable SMC2 - chromosome segregation protein [Melanopsichium pennsylvanicum]